MKVVLIVLILGLCEIANSLPDGFSYIHEVDPTIIVNARYASYLNFRGQPVTGYNKPIAIASTRLAQALKQAQKIFLNMGYSLVIYDAYRPQKSVNDFLDWINEPETNTTKQYFYPYIDKKNIVPDGYLAPRSGHTRGSRVDLTIIRLGQNLT